MKNKDQHNVGIGKRIKAARIKTNLSSIKVSQKIGLSDSICSQWERGNANPSTANLAKLSKVLKVSFEWLALGDIENKQQNTQDFEAVFSRLNAKQKHYLAQFVNSVV